MDDAHPLYQRLLLDHAKRPRNRGPLPRATHAATESNPLCGDTIAVHLTVERNRIVSAAFEGQGCAIAVAAASAMTEAVCGLDLAQTASLSASFETMLVSLPDTPGKGGVPGDLAAFVAVRAYPVRLKCALLSWRALETALRTPLVSNPRVDA